MMDRFLQDFLDMLFELFKGACITFQLIGVFGGVLFVALFCYLFLSPKGQYFLRWLHDEFGL